MESQPNLPNPPEVNMSQCNIANDEIEETSTDPVEPAAPKEATTKATIEGLISNKSPRLTFEKKQIKIKNRKASDAWSGFDVVILDKRPVDFVKCIKCN